MKKRAVTLILALLLLLGLSAPVMAAKSDFEIDEYGILIKYNGSGGDVMIPDGVTYISALSFLNCTNVTSVTIPESVDCVAYYSFEDCTNLKSVTIRPNVIELWGGAFSGCTGLTSVTILSTSLTAYGDPFAGCHNLTDVYLAGSQKQYDGDFITGLMDEGAAIHYNSTGPAAPTASGFTDVPDNAWYAAAVKWAVDNGITTGTSSTTFSPNDTCTRAQILTFLWRACGSPKTGAAGSFTDVPADAWYCDAAQWARSKGMISGTTLSPNAPCTRADTVMYIWQAMNKPAAGAEASFIDVPAGADYAAALAWAVEKGVTTGTSATNFSPNDTCTRGQIATFLNRAFA